MKDGQNEAMPVPGIKFVEHVAIAVRMGELEGQVKAYESLGFKEVHREEVWGGDQVREVLLQIGDGPNLIQLLEPRLVFLLNTVALSHNCLKPFFQISGDISHKSTTIERLMDSLWSAARRVN